MLLIPVGGSQTFFLTKSYLRRLVAFRTLSMFSNVFFSSICWRGAKGGGYSGEASM